MREITVTYNNAATSSMTLPGYLVIVEFTNTVYRWSSLDTIVFEGYSYTPMSMSISGLTSDVSANTQGSIRISSKNGDNTSLTVLALDSANFGFTSRPIKVYAFDKSLVVDGNLAEAICLFNGVGDDVSIEPTGITVALASANLSYMFSPRKRCTREFGFSSLQAKGTKITWANEIFILE